MATVEELQKELETLKAQIGTASLTDSKLDVLQTQMNQLAESIKASSKTETTIPDQSEEAFWKQFKDTPVDVITSVAKKVATDTKKEVLSTVHEQEEQKKWDAKAGAEFPELLQSGSPLLLEYQKVAAERNNQDTNWMKKPTAVYDTAQIAYARLVRQGKIMPDAVKEKLQQDIYASDGSLLPINRGMSTTQNPNQPTRSEAIWAQKMKVPIDKYMARKSKLPPPLQK